MTRVRRLFRLSPDVAFAVRGSRRGIALLASLALFGALCETFLLASIVQSVSALSAGRSSVNLNLGPVTRSMSVATLLGAAVVAAVFRGAVSATVALRGPRISARARERHRRWLFASYMRADWATQSADKTGRLMQVFSSSVNDANSMLLTMTQALPALVTLVVLIGVSLALNPLVTAVIVGCGLGIALALRPLSKRAHRAARLDAAGRQLTSAHVAGSLTAAAEITVLGARAGVIGEADRRIQHAERNFARAQGLKRVVSITSQSIAFLLAAAGLWILSLSHWRVDFAVVGTIAVLLLRGAGLSQVVQSATSQYGALRPFIEQVRTLGEYYTARRQTFGNAAFPSTFDLDLHQVEYSYPGSETLAVDLDDVHFAQGHFVGIVGPSGSGKSTLIQLILRLRDATRGELLLGGLPLSEIDEDEFSRNVAYVPQAPHLITGTIMENIAFFREGVTAEAAVEAAKQVNFHDDVVQLPQGYDTLLDGHVAGLSGGQRQRLALARALVARPRVLVLDEPTSALDARNESAVMETVSRLRGRTTVIMITHKLTTVTGCDAVFVVESGRLREASAPDLHDVGSAAPGSQARSPH